MPRKAVKPAGWLEYLSVPEIRMLFAITILSVILGLSAPRFVTVENLINILRQVAVVAIVAFGATFVLVAGEFDMSVGALLSLAGCLGGVLAARGATPGAVVAAAILVGSVAGFLNGLLVVRLGINAFVATLGTLMLFRGISNIVSGGINVSFYKFSDITFLGKGFVGPFPVLIIFMFSCLLVSHVLLNNTRFGRWIYAIGGSVSVSRYSGVPVRLVKTVAFIVGGAFAGLAGILLAARIGATTSTLGIGYEFDAIAAVVLGGTPLSGGRGTVGGTFLGAAFVAILRAGLTLLGVVTEVQMIAIGVVLISGVAMTAYTRRR